MIFSMKRQILLRALTFGIAASALILTSCSTTETRISNHPDIFQTLSPRDQALVREGKIREGMSQDAVWLAWGTPDQKATGRAPPETRHRFNRAASWHPELFIVVLLQFLISVYGGYFGGGVVFHRHHGHRFAVIGDPFFDPFYYSYIPPRVAYPDKTVSFVNGRVVSIQVLTPPRY